MADGKLTVFGKKLLTALDNEPPMTDAELAQKTETPLFRIRSGLRNLKAAGFVSKTGNQRSIIETLYSITGAGKEALKTS